MTVPVGVISYWTRLFSEALNEGGPSLIQGQSMWNFWWTKQH